MIVIDKIIRSNRKSISIQVVENGNLIVRAPKRVTKREINQIIIKHKEWILKKQAIVKSRIISKKQFVEDEIFLLFGKKHYLKFNDKFKTPIIFDDKIVVSKFISEKWEYIFELWYKKVALDFFLKRAVIYSKLLGVRYTKIKLSSAKTRWGSCSSKGNINLSWRLIMAPVQIIDYVVVHELAHLIEPNHSHKFWFHVGRILPEYRILRKWLKENGYMLKL